MSDENALALSPAETAALIPSSLDAIKSPVHADSSKPEGARVTVPYVGFRGKKTNKNVEALEAAGIGVQQFYLMDIEPIKIAPMAFHVLQYARFFTNTDDDGKVVEAAFETDDSLFEAGFREHLYAAVAVKTGPGTFTAATLQLQSAQCAALRQTIAMLGEPGRPGPATDAAKWAQRSEKHKVSAHAAVPGGRFVTEIWSTLTNPVGGKGQPYNEGHGRVFPTPAADVDAFNAWTKSDWPRIQVALTKYNMMVASTRKTALATAGA